MGKLLVDQGRYAEAAQVLRTAEAEHAAAVELAAHHADEHRGWVSQRRQVEFLARERNPASPTEHLELADARYGVRESAAAVEAYLRAFEDDGVRGDLERSNLYHAACAAALAASADPERAAGLNRQAVAWLSEDFATRRSLLETLESGVAVGGADRAELETRRAAVVGHIQWAQLGEPSLAALRGTPAFDALFEATPGEE